MRDLVICLTLAISVTCTRESAEPQTAVVRALENAGNGELMLPNALTSVKFAVIGDSGRGTPEQHQVAAQMARFRARFKYNFVVMLGDNIYEGPASADDYRRKFEEPYRVLLQDGVKFYAVLGNHDDPRQVAYPPFNMNGQRYYSFAPPEDPLTRLTTPVEFFALDSTNVDGAQLAWLEERLALSRADWKIVLLHHPLYTSGRYRNSARAHRLALEPILTHYRVNLVLSGHEHIYQRSELQQNILYFVSGGAGSLRQGDGVAAPYIARSFDDDYHFMLMEIERDAAHFQVVSRAGDTVDAGSLYRDATKARELTPADTAAPR